MSKQQKRRNLVAIVILLATGILACSQFVPLFLPTCKEPASIPHTIAQSENFEQTWEQSPIIIDASNQAIYMIANEQHLVFYGTTDLCQRNARLINVNPEDGNHIYNGTKIMPSGIIHDTAYHFELDLFFLGYGGTGKINNTQNFSANTGGVAAYSMEDGEIIWSQPIPGTRGIDSLVASNHTVAIDRGSRSDEYYLLETQTGKIISKLAKYSPSLPEPGANANMAYWYDNESNPQAPDNENITFWAKRFEQVSQSPLLTEQTLIIRRELGTNVGMVAALDRQSGEIIWEAPNVISNVAVNQSTAFFLTASAELVATDLETGQKVGSITFSPLSSSTGKNHSYFVAANDTQTFVYFGDSYQLLTLNFLE